MMKENRMQASTEDTLRVVKESIHDSMYESSKTLVKRLHNIGDKLANVVEDFQKKQQTRNSRDRDRNGSNSRDRNNSRDNYRNRSWDRRDNRDRYRNRSGDRRDSRDNSRDRDRGSDRDRSNSKEEKRNQPRSGSGQRYFARNDFCNYCNRTGHVIGTMYRNYHRSALIVIFVFPGLLPKIMRPSSQECACPTLTYACLAKHNSK